MTLRTDLISNTSASDYADQHNGANTRILDVRDYGADPTGSTGDLAGGTIRVPPGDYRLASNLAWGYAAANP